MNTISLLGTTLGLGVTSGLNLYATVFGTGLALRFGWIRLVPGLEPLAWLSHPAVLAVSGFLFLVEFLADKIPVVEHLWDLIHTFIRPVGASLLAWKAMGANYGDMEEFLLILMAGGVSLATHAGKSGLRLASTGAGGQAFGVGVLLSLVEDFLVFVLAPLSVAHPAVALALAVIVLVAAALVVPMGFRFLFSRIAALRYSIRHKLPGNDSESLDRTEIPYRAAQRLSTAGVRFGGESIVLPGCAMGLKGVPRWSSGFAVIGPKGVGFVSAGLFRTRFGEVPWEGCHVALSSHLFGYRLRCDGERRRVTIAFYPLTTAMGQRLKQLVPAAPSRSLAVATDDPVAVPAGGRIRRIGP